MVPGSLRLSRVNMGNLRFRLFFFFKKGNVVLNSENYYGGNTWGTVLTVVYFIRSKYCKVFKIS